MRGGEGLTAIPLRDLRTMLSRLHRGALVAPITHQQLVVAGLPHLVDRVGFLSGLDASAVRAVLVAVIAERKAAEARATRSAT
jgi:hypothetical protein